MVIRIKSRDGTNLWLPLPGGLIFNRLTASIAAKAAAETGVSLDPAQLARLFAAARKYRRSHPDWVFVEVQSADGDYVRIRL